MPPQPLILRAMSLAPGPGGLRNSRRAPLHEGTDDSGNGAGRTAALGRADRMPGVRQPRGKLRADHCVRGVVAHDGSHARDRLRQADAPISIWSISAKRSSRFGSGARGRVVGRRDDAGLLLSECASPAAEKATRLGIDNCCKHRHRWRGPRLNCSRYVHPVGWHAHSLILEDHHPGWPVDNG